MLGGGDLRVIGGTIMYKALLALVKSVVLFIPECLEGVKQE